MAGEPLRLTREQCRALDRHAIEVLGVPGVVLMENAGRGATDWIERWCARQGRSLRAAILCGRGNNGGDGFVIARHLLLRGHEPTVYLAADPAGITGDAAVMFAPLERLGIPVRPLRTAEQLATAAGEWGSCNVIVDALLGTGFAGQVRSPMAEIIAAVTALAGPTVVAVDVPSGLDCDTGTPGGTAVRANHTVTFVAEKVGFAAPEAREYVGEVVVADIGVPPKTSAEC